MNSCNILFWIGVFHFWIGIFMGNTLIQWVGIFLGGGALLVALSIAILNYLHGKYTN